MLVKGYLIPIFGLCVLQYSVLGNERDLCVDVFDVGLKEDVGGIGLRVVRCQIAELSHSLNC